MRLALILGEAQGNSVKPKLKSVKDNLDIDVFGSIPKFIDIALKRNCIYDRILVLGSMLTDCTLTDLYNYWCASSKETNIVLLCKKGKDDELANSFMQTFLSTNTAAMLVETTTVQILAESVLLDTQTITSKYGITDYLKVEVDLDVYEEPKVEVEQPIQQVQQPTQKAPQQVKNDKKGFLSGLFKSNKQKHEEAMRALQQKREQGVLPQNTQSQSIDSSKFVEQQAQDLPSNEVNISQGTDNSQVKEVELDMSNQQEQMIQSSMCDSMVENEVSDIGNIGVIEDSFDSGDDNEFSNNSNITNGYENYHEDDYINTRDSFNDGFDYSSSDVDSNNDSYEENKQEINSVKQTVIEDDLNFSETSMMFSSSDDSFDESKENRGIKSQEDTYSRDNDFEPEDVESNIDFSYTNAYTGTEVDDVDLSTVDVADAEEAYRQKAEQSKVITKTVVKEVVKNVGIGGSSILKSVYAGRQRKVVVVTGDRGTGVTSTALKLAYEFAKHVPVLYFDCDVDNHGLLNYINYSQFRNYEPIHMQGIKLCRNSKAFNNCVVAFDTNLDILTTDFSCDVTDDELEQAQGIVAERSNDYGIVIVDCPVTKLHCISDLILTGVSVMCVEASKRGFMNMLCRFESSPLQLRYKRTIVSKGLMFLTKSTKDVNIKKVVEYVKSLYQPDDIDWLSMNMKTFNGSLNDNLLNEILEG